MGIMLFSLQCLQAASHIAWPWHLWHWWHSDSPSPLQSSCSSHTCFWSSDPQSQSGGASDRLVASPEPRSLASLYHSWSPLTSASPAHRFKRDTAGVCGLPENEKLRDLTAHTRQSRQTCWLTSTTSADSQMHSASALHSPNSCESFGQCPTIIIITISCCIPLAWWTAWAGLRSSSQRSGPRPTSRVFSWSCPNGSSPQHF